MLSIDEAKWNKIDKDTEVTKIGKYRFVRPVNSKTIPLDCPSCKKLYCMWSFIPSQSSKVMIPFRIN